MTCRLAATVLEKKKHCCKVSFKNNILRINYFGVSRVFADNAVIEASPNVNLDGLKYLYSPKLKKKCYAHHRKCRGNLLIRRHVVKPWNLFRPLVTSAGLYPCTEKRS